ncbi:MAG: hypothetical protein U0Q12_12695 [Vicinamibacterales bacterium]
MTTVLTFLGLWVALACGVLAVHYIWRKDGGWYQIERRTSRRPRHQASNHGMGLEA